MHVRRNLSKKLQLIDKGKVEVVSNGRKKKISAKEEIDQKLKRDLRFPEGSNLKLKPSFTYFSNKIIIKTNKHILNTIVWILVNV